MALFPSRDLRGLLTLFTFSRKRDLERYCRELVVYGSDFANMIVACEDGILPFQHEIHYTEIVANECLRPTKALGDALTANGVGPLQGETKKAVRRMFQFFEERRWLVGHLFYTPDLGEWYFIYFDQRDTESQRPNHWVGGPHIHLVNWLWPRLDARTVWTDFVTKNAVPRAALHIRHKDEPARELIERMRKPSMSSSRS